MKDASTPHTKSHLAGAFGGLRSALIPATLISGVINLLALTGSIYMLQVYDRVLTSHSIPTLVVLSLLAVVLYLFQGVLDVLRNQASGRVASLFDTRLTRPVQHLVLHQAVQSISRTSAQQPLRDVDAIRSFLASGGPIAFLDLPWMPIYLVFVFVLHPLLGALCLTGIVVLVGLTYGTEFFSKSVAVAVARADSERRAIADANARSAEVLQAMGFADRAVTRFEQANRRFLNQQTSAGDIISNISGLSRVFRLVIQSAILGLGAYLTVHGDVTAGAIIAASIASSRALAPVEQVIANWRGFLAARQGYKRLKQAFAAAAPATRPLSLPAPAETLRVENLCVAVPGAQELVLSNITFELRRGQALAVIGPSAAGKSSLARAITGIWPATRGNIRLDGAELGQWSVEDRGRHIGYVPQDVTLFDGSVAENIGRLEAECDSRAIISAARAAGVHEMILGLPNGYETRVGPDGIALSAGQRQRIALARALYRDPFLVVLDEPNSNLDAEGETALTNAILSVRQRGGIVVVIAHRPSALAAADLIAMIGAGQFTAFGPKDEVLKKVLRQPIRSVAQTAP
jgi:ATP-binding cassette, subfamily C, bacterial